MSTEKLRTTALVCIIYGYFLFLGILIIILGAIGIFCAYRSYTSHDQALVNG
jgi:hypothetical protein